MKMKAVPKKKLAYVIFASLAVRAVVSAGDNSQANNQEEYLGETHFVFSKLYFLIGFWISKKLFSNSCLDGLLVVDQFLKLIILSERLYSHSALPPQTQ